MDKDGRIRFFFHEIDLNIHFMTAGRVEPGPGGGQDRSVNPISTNQGGTDYAPYISARPTPRLGAIPGQYVKL